MQAIDQTNHDRHYLMESVKYNQWYDVDFVRMKHVMTLVALEERVIWHEGEVIELILSDIWARSIKGSTFVLCWLLLTAAPLDSCSRRSSC